MACALRRGAAGPAASCSISRTARAVFGEMHAHAAPAGVGAVLSSHRHRDQLAVAREHGVGARDLEQRRRQAVAVAHRRLLDRPPGLVRAQPAGDGAGKAELRLLAEADRAVQLPHLARRASASPSCTAPTLLDFWITSRHRQRCRAGARRVMVEPADRDAAGRGLDHGVRRDAAALQRPARR